MQLMNSTPLKDKNNIIYKYPEKTCKNCKKYPCFKGFDFINLDFAKYGCLNYEAGSKRVYN